MPRVLRAAPPKAGRRGPAGRAAPRHLIVRDHPRNAETSPRALGAYLTPAADRFVRSNFAVPRLSRRSHRLCLGGLVESPLSLGVEELCRLPQRTLTVTTECAGNHRTTMSPLPPGEPWSGGAVSTARWTGVPLGALHPDTMVALRMNGEKLLPAHGAPLRLVVPGWYGMASVKWLANVEVVAEPFAGYFQAERYVYREPGKPPAPVAEMRVKAVFTSPLPGAKVAMGPALISGFAWSGGGRIAKVEVACSGGDDWVPARLIGEDEPYAWRAWELIWTPPWRGRHVLRCRATDEAGRTQPDLPRWNELGYGANGVQSLHVDVR